MGIHGGFENVFQDVPDADLLRFLRARSMSVTKASKMFAEHQKWRREYFPSGLGYAQEDEIRDELDAEKFFIQGHDKLGRPIALVFAAKHISSGKKNVDKYKRDFPAPLPLHFVGCMDRFLPYVLKIISTLISSFVLQVLSHIFWTNLLQGIVTLLTTLQVNIEGLLSMYSHW